MPAIQITKVRTQISLLLPVFNQPELFVAKLHDLYTSYADKTFPIGTSNASKFEEAAFQVPILLNRELELAFTPECVRDPEIAIKVINQLWQEFMLEPRQLGATLLGRLPMEYFDQVIERIRTWSIRGEEASLLAFLHRQGTVGIRRDDPNKWIEVLESWQKSKNLQEVKLSIAGLVPLIEDPDFANLPVVFNLLTPSLESLEPRLTFILQKVIQKLAVKSQAETIFFLKQIITSSKDPGISRFIRRSLNSFSAEYQGSLKRHLKEHEKSNN